MCMTGCVTSTKHCTTLLNDMSLAMSRHDGVYDQRHHPMRYELLGAQQAEPAQGCEPCEPRHPGNPHGFMNTLCASCTDGTLGSCCCDFGAITSVRLGCGTMAAAFATDRRGKDDLISDAVQGG